MRYLLTIILLVFSHSFLSFAQISLAGTVQDRKGEPIFAANVYLKSAPQNGVASDFNGNFSLNIVNLKDTLIVSFIGYETKEIPVKSIDIPKSIVVILKKIVKR